MKTPKRILDRRRSIRIQDALPFQIGHQGYDFQVSSVNISAHGAMFLIEQDIPMMTQLDIALTIPSASGSKESKKTTHIKGVVVRKDIDVQSGKYYVAVYFSGIKEADQKALNEYIEHRA
jgi:c-di-GMP-binding flagellar brake protein YcgR